jgi:hypothetical protein
MDCSVCCETVRCSTCPYCNYVCCTECLSTFLLGLSKDAHCMNCNKLWNREVLLRVLPKSFVNGKYRDHRENILFEREKSLFPAMQVIISRERRFEELDSMKKKLRAAKPVDYVLLGQVSEVRRKLFDLYHPANGPKKEKKKFVRKCPVENCKGFVSSKWKCGMCENTVCKDCNEVGEHTCDPGAVETMKLLKNDTKPCPTCGEMIFKASGCSQMWCTSCHAVFDWNTMQLETGLIHNPHYYEFQRRNGTLERHPGDVPCGELPRYGQLIVFGKNMEQLTYLGHVHRLCVHIMDYIRRLRFATDINSANRKRFMKGEITEYQFKTRIQRSEKAREKNRDVTDIMTMFRDSLRDLLIQVVQRKVQVEELENMVINLGEYVNESLRKVKVLYDNCVMQFMDFGTMTMKFDSVVK